MINNNDKPVGYIYCGNTKIYTILILSLFLYIECEITPFECSNGRVIVQYYSVEEGRCVYPNCNTPAPVTNSPTEGPTERPITQPINVTDTTIEPTKQPTYDPTENPTPKPTDDETPEPTLEPTKVPTEVPTLDVGTDGSEKRKLSIFVLAVLLFVCL